MNQIINGKESVPMNMNEQKRTVSFIDIENWLSYYKIRHTIVTNLKSRKIIIMIRLNNFNTMCVNCDARVRKPEQVMAESVLISKNNIYEMEDRYKNKLDYTIYKYDMASGYTQTASSFFACAIVNSLSL